MRTSRYGPSQVAAVDAEVAQAGQQRGEIWGQGSTIDAALDAEILEVVEAGVVLLNDRKELVCCGWRSRLCQSACVVSQHKLAYQRSLTAHALCWS